MTEETVTLPASEVKALLTEMAAMKTTMQQLMSEKGEQNLEDGKLKAKVVHKHDVTIMFVDGKPVVGLENVGSEANPVRLYDVPDKVDPKKMVLTANIQVRDLDTKAVTTITGVNFLEFVQEAERRECPVIKQTGERWIMNQGTTVRKTLDGDSYKMKEHDIELDMEIEGTEYHYIVDVDGKPLEIHQDYVNMAKSSPKPVKEYVGSVVV